MDSLNDTSLIIPVQEAAFVQSFRVKHLHRPGVTMPPHITVHAPFRPMSAIDTEVLDRLAALCQAHPAFSFTLAQTARFSDNGVLYLVPEPDEPFQVLSQAIGVQFPEAPSDHPNPIIHLTLARTDPAELDHLEAEFYQTYNAQLPIAATATELWLFEQQGNIWVKQAAFALFK
jgi:2'-5' RNA ligase